jgi:hypothetical protein
MRAGAQARYGGSLWNAWLDAKLAVDLTVAEHKLADALARNVIGFGGKTIESLGNNLLRREARLSGFNLDKARDGLAQKGLIAFQSSGKGRGARTSYTLLPDETTADEGSFVTEPETAALRRSIPEETTAGMTALMTARMTALERSRIKDERENTKCSRPSEYQTVDVGPGDPDWIL